MTSGARPSGAFGAKRSEWVMMPRRYCFCFVAPEGALTTEVTLEPNRVYRSDELTVRPGRPDDEHDGVMTVTGRQLPSEMEFRDLAARAATRAAMQADRVKSLVNALIPF